MQIFVSWSGTPARDLAEYLQVWLRKVIQELDPFMSKNSIEKGARWSPEISARLEETSQAIVCVTSANQRAEWLNFEAGALAKATDSRVRTLLVDVTPANVTGPLSEFQHTLATDMEDVRSLIKSINDYCARPLPEEILNATFEREWPALDAKVAEVVVALKKSNPVVKSERSNGEIMAEVLDRVRSLERLGKDQLDVTRALAEQISGPPALMRDALYEREMQERRIRAQTEQLTKELEGLPVTIDYKGADPDGWRVKDVVTRGDEPYARLKNADGRALTVPLNTIRLVETTDLIERYKK